MLRAVFYFLMATAVFSQSSFSADIVDRKKQEVLAGLKNGNLVRIICDEHDAIGGKFIAGDADSLYLGADDRAVSAKKPSRRVMRKGRTLKSAPEFGPLERDTRVAVASIREIHVRGRATLTGTLVGGAIGGLGGLVLGAIANAMDDRATGTPSSEIAGIAGVSVLGGSMVGTVVGSMFHRWKLKFREPGFRGGVGVNPVLSVRPDRQLSNSAVLYAGINLTW
ncbi:MAG: hypothetical protein JSW34_08980 [Candidatus Zixiibacteriota bacterium]|nr:MAG: hypothetical protein JSW34_08980 [candidate division Zixibacteria bacterium]